MRAIQSRERAHDPTPLGIQPRGVHPRGSEGATRALHQAVERHQAVTTRPMTTAAPTAEKASWTSSATTASLIPRAACQSAVD
jgi:hypothetical protein